MNSFITLDVSGYAKLLMRAVELYTHEVTMVTHACTQGHFQDIQVGPNQTVRRFVTFDEDVTYTIDPLVSLTYRRALDIITVFVDEYLSQTTRYRDPIDPLPQIASSLREDTAHPSKADIVMAERFLTDDLVDTVVVELHRMLAMYVGNETWRQWDVHTTNAMVALIGRQDYRIQEWEDINGVYDEDIVIDINTLGHYLYQKLEALHPGSANHIPMALLLSDAITRRYPGVRFPYDTAQLPVFFQALNPHWSYEGFYNDIVRPLMSDFAVTCLRRFITADEEYKAEITPGLVVTFTPQPLSNNQRHAYYEDIAQSIARGDYVPERLRRELEDYQHNG